MPGRRPALRFIGTMVLSFLDGTRGATDATQHGTGTTLFGWERVASRPLLSASRRRLPLAEGGTVWFAVGALWTSRRDADWCDRDGRAPHSNPRFGLAPRPRLAILSRQDANQPSRLAGEQPHFGWLFPDPFPGTTAPPAVESLFGGSGSACTMNDPNPYKSRTTPSAKADVLTDFRSRAVAASEMMRRNQPSGLSPAKGGVSSCLVRQPDLSRLRAPIKVCAVASPILSLIGVACGGIFFLLMKGTRPADDPTVFAMAVCCTVGGVLSMFLSTYVERLIVRQHLSQREEDSGSGSERKGIHVSLEYAPTYGAMKILAEDVGLLYIHPEAHYVRMNGLSYDYVIQSKDVVRLSLHSNRKSVLLSYTVGDERLDLAIVPRSVRAEFKRQMFGSSRSLFVKIQDALERKG